MNTAISGKITTGQHMDHFQVMARVEAAVDFLEKHDTPVDVLTIAQLTIAFREMGHTEWTPGTRQIDKLVIISPPEHELGYCAYIYGPGLEFNEQLTSEFNAVVLGAATPIQTTDKHIYC